MAKPAAGEHHPRRMRKRSAERAHAFPNLLQENLQVNCLSSLARAATARHRLAVQKPVTAMVLSQQIQSLQPA
jgi:hypothetical protein